MTTSKVETHRFEHKGDQTVAVAAELIGKLPNGWTLKRFEYQNEYPGGTWTAVVQEPEVNLT